MAARLCGHFVQCSMYGHSLRSACNVRWPAAPFTASHVALNGIIRTLAIGCQAALTFTTAAALSL